MYMIMIIAEILIQIINYNAQKLCTFGFGLGVCDGGTLLSSGNKHRATGPGLGSGSVANCWKTLKVN